MSGIEPTTTTAFVEVIIISLLHVSVYPNSTQIVALAFLFLSTWSIKWFQLELLFQRSCKYFAPTNKARDGSYINRWYKCRNLTLFFGYQMWPTLLYALYYTLLLTKYWSSICSKTCFRSNISWHDFTCTHTDLAISQGHLSGNGLLWTWKFPVEVDLATWSWKPETNRKQTGKESHTNWWRHWLRKLLWDHLLPLGSFLY